MESKNISGTAQKKGLLTLFLVLLILLCALPSAEAEVVDRILANVNGKIILLSELEERQKLLSGMGGDSAKSKNLQDRKKVLDNMIDEEIVLTHAKRLEITIRDEEIDKAILKVAQRNKTDLATLEKMLSAQGLTMKKYREKMREQMMIRRVTQMEIPKPSVTQQMVKNYFEDHRSEFSKPVRVRASHIILLASKKQDPEYFHSAEKKIMELKKKLLAGADFEKMARKESQDGSAKSGGDLGWFTRGNMVKEFEDMAFSLDVGEIGGPVTTPFGLHLIKVTAKEESEPIEFEKVKKKVRAKLIDKEFSEKRKDWMKRLRANAYIEIRSNDEGSMF